jgi:hypothetical protein
MSNQFADVFKRYKAAVICFAALISVAWLGWGQFYTTALKAVPVNAVLLKANRVSDGPSKGGGKTRFLYEYELIPLVIKGISQRLGQFGWDTVQVLARKYKARSINFRVSLKIEEWHPLSCLGLSCKK